MLPLSSEQLEALGLSISTLAVCWRIEKKNGELILGTEHDCNIPVEDDEIGGLYLAHAGMRGSDIKSTADMSVPNMEVQGSLKVDDFVPIPDVTIADIESGVLDGASVEVFLVDWQNPGAGIITRRFGFLGHFERDSNGRYVAEVLGLVQLLSQNIGRTAGETCDATFGDARCKFDVASKTRTGTVTAIVGGRKHFTGALDPGPEPLTTTYYNYGNLKFTSGANDTFFREVKKCVVTGSAVDIELWEEAPADIEVGDTFNLPPGCDKRYTTCRDVHGNLLNMRAPGVFVQGVLDLIKGPS